MASTPGAEPLPPGFRRALSEAKDRASLSFQPAPSENLILVVTLRITGQAFTEGPITP